LYYQCVFSDPDPATIFLYSAVTFFQAVSALDVAILFSMTIGPSVVPCRIAFHNAPTTGITDEQVAHCEWTLRMDCSP
jgi:hypothetical protein